MVLYGAFPMANGTVQPLPKRFFPDAAHNRLDSSCLEMSFRGNSPALAEWRLFNAAKTPMPADVLGAGRITSAHAGALMSVMAANALMMCLRLSNMALSLFHEVNDVAPTFRGGRFFVRISQ